MNSDFVNFSYSPSIVETIFAIKESIPGFKLSKLFRRTLLVFAKDNGLECDDSNPSSIILEDTIINPVEENNEILFVKIKGGIETCRKIKKLIVDSKTLFALPVYGILSCHDDFENNISMFEVALFTSEIYNHVIVAHQNPDIEEMRVKLNKMFKKNTDMVITIDDLLYQFSFQGVEIEKLDRTDDDGSALIQFKELFEYVGCDSKIMQLLVLYDPLTKYIKAIKLYGFNLQQVCDFVDAHGAFLWNNIVNYLTDFHSCLQTITLITPYSFK